MAKVSIKEAEALRVSEDFVLASVDPASTPGVSEDNVEDAFDEFDDELDELQECLYANGRAGNENAGSILLVLQGMDTASTKVALSATLWVRRWTRKACTSRPSANQRKKN